MKIVQINTVLNVGSTGRICENIGDIVIEKGGDSYIVFGRDASESNSKAIKIGNFVSKLIHFLGTKIWDKHGLYSKHSTKRIVEKLNEIEPDVIHLHNIHGYYINYKILFEFLRVSKIPVVWTLHDCWPFTGHCAYYDFVGCSKWQTECFNCEQINSYPSSYIFDRSKKNFQDKFKSFNGLPNLTLVPVSNWLKAELQKSFLKNYNINVIHNGVDIDVFKSIKHNYVKLEKPYILGVAGDWIPRKGFSDFIKLSNIVNNDYCIVMIGLSKKQIASLPKNIIGIERTNDVVELAKFYSGALVFFNPTYEDNFPTTNLESLSCGTPVITYDTGGSPEALDEKTGYTVNKGDLNTVVSLIKEIKNKDQKKLSADCRNRAVEFYNKDEKFKSYYSLYNQILKNVEK